MMSDDEMNDSLDPPVCEGYFKSGIMCLRPAVLAVVENGDYVPVCVYHSNVARHAVWSLGTLRRQAKHSKTDEKLWVRL